MAPADHGETLYAVEYRRAGEEGHGLFAGVDDVAVGVDLYLGGDGEGEVGSLHQIVSNWSTWADQAK